MWFWIGCGVAAVVAVLLGGAIFARSRRRAVPEHQEAYGDLPNLAWPWRKP